MTAATEIRRPRLLFVDDEPQILDALADLLRRDRKRWDVVFAHSAAEALDELAKAPCDIVVTDMRMPGMDGAALLAEVKARHPGVTRMVLSGYADRGALMRAIGIAQQFFSKPCDAVSLRSTLERALTLRQCAGTEQVQRIVGRITHLPSAPDTYLAIERLSGDSSRGIRDVADVIERDPSLCVRVLQLVNSSYFGVRREIRGIHQAVSFVGIELLKVLALTASTFSAGHDIAGLEVGQLQRDALLGAKLAARIAPPELAEEAFTAAFVRDIGLIVLSLGIPETMRQVHDLIAAHPEVPPHAIEQRVAGVTHAEVGAYLLGLWGLPLSLVEAVGHHHAPMRVPVDHRTLVSLVHAADALIEHGDATLDHDALASTGFGDRLDDWRAIASELRKESP